MPVTFVNIEWPDANYDSVYSPSSIIEDYFNPGELLSVKDFKKRCVKALNTASERVRHKYGFACTGALREAERISNRCKEFESKNKIKIISIKK